MKVSYICEICGKPYGSEPEAKKCEQTHEEIAKKRAEEHEREAKLLEAINNAVNLYVQNYHKMPVIALSEENEEIYVESITQMLSETLSAIAGLKQ